MKPTTRQQSRVVVWLGAGCLGLLTLSAPFAQEPRVQATLRGHTDRVRSVAFSPDGKTLASGGWDNRIKVWDVATGREKATFRGHAEGDWITAVVFSPDGKLLASGSTDDTIKLWDVPTGKNTATLKSHSDTGSDSSLAFSPDGKTLVGHLPCS
jgi:WD40 repeat protein